MRKLKAIVFNLDELAAFTAAERYYFLKVCYRKFPMIKDLVQLLTTRAVAVSARTESQVSWIIDLNQGLAIVRVY